MRPPQVLSFRRFGGLLLGSALFASSALATTYAEHLDLPTLDARAETIVRGKVIGLRAETAGKRGLIQTIVTLEVAETYRGRAGSTLEVVAPGGTLEGVHLDVAGAPRFEKGQEVVVFLKGRTIVGFGQGAFLVEGGIARRALGNAVEHAELNINLERAWGRPAEAQVCQQNRLEGAYAEGWNLRAADTVRLGREEEAAYELTLVKGNHYRLRACGDGEAAGLDLALVDEEGMILASSRAAGAQLDLEFSPETTGSYFLVASAQGFDPQVLRSAINLSVEFR